MWHERSSLEDIWKDENLSFEQRRDAIVNKFKKSNWYKDNLDLQDIIYEIENTEDPDDYYWNCMYDLADEDKIWIATF